MTRVVFGKLWKEGSNFGIDTAMNTNRELIDYIKELNSKQKQKKKKIFCGKTQIHNQFRPIQEPDRYWQCPFTPTNKKLQTVVG